MDSIFAFSIFATVASITPGPTNILVLTTSQRYGVLASGPLILGSCLAAALIVLFAALGLGQLLIQFTLLKWLMTWAGALWLTWMAWGLFVADGRLTSEQQSERKGWKTGAGLQLINPKAWMMALAVSSVFIGAEADPERIMLLTGVFFLIAIPCLLCWALLGQGANLWLKQHQQRWFNRILSILLLLSVWWAVWLDYTA